MADECGHPLRSAAKSWPEEYRRCRLPATVTSNGRRTCWMHRAVKPPRPTILTFHGETGEDSASAWALEHPWPAHIRTTTCPAPTPEAP